ncbi:hypothetical protein chiPu_0032726, partial [Chiloscyllium punctatum]|nr:hypothetical protein [Chiloscyllium punctatum]
TRRNCRCCSRLIARVSGRGVGSDRLPRLCLRSCLPSRDRPGVSRLRPVQEQWRSTAEISASPSSSSSSSDAVRRLQEALRRLAFRRVEITGSPLGAAPGRRRRWWLLL